MGKILIKIKIIIKADINKKDKIILYAISMDLNNYKGLKIRP